MKIKVTKKSWMEEQHSFDVELLYCCPEAKKHLHSSSEGDYVYIDEYIAYENSCNGDSKELRIKWCPFCGAEIKIE